MKFKIKNLEIYIEYTVIIVAFLNIIPSCRRYLENYYVCFLFIIFHELSHVLVSSLFGINTKRICVKLCGLNINVDSKSQNDFKWILIYMAGPLSNLLLAVLFKRVEMIYYINLCLMIINLIPIKPLDGYNILNILLFFIKTKKRKQILLILQYVIMFILLIIGMLQICLYKNLSIILITIYVFIELQRDEYNGKNTMYQKYYKNITNF